MSRSSRCIVKGSASGRLPGTCTSVARWSSARSVLEPFRSACPLAGARANSIPTCPTCESVGSRAVTTAVNWRVRSRREDFAAQPRWSASSLVTGGHACLGHRSGYVARNDRQLAPVKRRLSPRHASWLFVTDQQQLTADQRALIERICHTNADLQDLYQLGQDFVQMVKQRQARRLDPGLLRLTRVPRWNCGDLLLASSGITPPSKPRCLFLGVRDRWRVRLRA